MNVWICIGSSCHLRGAEAVIKKFQKMITEEGLKAEIELGGSFCMGACSQGVSVKVEDKIYHVKPDEAEEFFRKVIQKKGDN